MAEGKKGRKIGRKKRKPAQMRYVLSGRLQANRAKKAARHEKRLAYFAKRRAKKLAGGSGTPYKAAPIDD